MISYTSFVFFLLYFGIMYLFYIVMPQKAKWCVLLVGSYAFYFVSSKGHILPLILSTVVTWAIGLVLDKLSEISKAKRKLAEKPEKKLIRAKYNRYMQWVLALGTVLVIGSLLVCKYSNFFIDTTNSIFGTTIGELKVVQPLGISFFVLQAVSYMTDVHHGKIKAEKNPFRVSLYLSFMLTIVEGPVARYDQLGTQLQKCKIFNTHDLVNGAIRATWGLIKKIIIADRAAELVNAVFDNYNDYSGVAVIAAILFYTLQLYCEFSGVMDIVSGLGEMLGINLPDNFNRPFFAKSINEFWQRWHITLGSWLRDYIFYPISLSKPFMSLTKSARKKFNPYYANLIPTAVALFFVWFGNGFWHGAGWKYIVYGLYYYLLMMLGLFLEPVFAFICKKLKINRESKPFGIFRMIRTFVIVNFGMLIFRADDLTVAGKMIKSVFTGFDLSIIVPGSKNGFGLDLYDYAILAVGTLLVFAIGLLYEKKIDVRERIFKLPYLAKMLLFLVMIYSVIIFGAYGEGYGVVDLIYANF